MSHRHLQTDIGGVLKELKQVHRVEGDTLIPSFNDRTRFENFRVKNPQALFEVCVADDYRGGNGISIDILFYTTGDLTKDVGIKIPCASVMELWEILRGKSFDVHSFLRDDSDYPLTAVINQVLLMDGHIEVVDDMVRNPNKMVLGLNLNDHVIYTDPIRKDVWGQHFEKIEQDPESDD